MKNKTQILTQKGRDFFEISSAFQKSLRRCDEHKTLSFATELINSNYEKYLWKRIVVMVSEDIGLADPQLPQQVYALQQNYYHLKEAKAKEYKLPIYHALLLMIRSQKSRLVDWCHGRYQDGYYYDDVEPIPDYALDMHTRQGKRMGKNIDDFFDEGAVLNNHTDLAGESDYREWCKKHWCDADWRREQRKRERDFVPAPKIKEQEQENLFGGNK